jgi:hypothetical protein
MKNFSEPITRLIKEINTAIIFSKPSGHPHQTGWLSRIIKNEWKSILDARRRSD